MLPILMACAEGRLDSSPPEDATSTTDGRAGETACTPTEDVQSLPPALIHFDATAAMERAASNGEGATQLEVWLISLSFADYDENRCDDTLKPEYVQGAFIQDLTESRTLDANLTGAEGWSVVAVTMNRANEALETWFGEVATTGGGESDISL